jgi:gliding motility-associatede transport system auxiliary component
METIKRNLNYLGLALLAAGLMALRIWPQTKAAGLAMAAAGVAAIGVYIVLNLSSFKRSFSRKSFLYSSNLLLIVVIVLGIVVLANYFLSRHHLRVDFTEAKLHSLSDQTIQVLKNLKTDVQVKGFFRESNYSRPKMDDLLKTYGYYSTKIKYEFIDPDKNPALVKAYNVTQDGTTVLECAGQENRITTATEEDLTNAIIKVTRVSKKVIYFLEGHGEAGIEETGDIGYSFAKDELIKLSYEVKKLTLAVSETFPADCAVLVIPGPRKDLLPNELETIGKYIDRGGRVLFMLDPGSAPDLDPFLLKYGVKLGPGVVVDAISRMFGADYTMPVITEYDYSPITRGFRYATFFPYARPVDPADQKPEGAVVTTLGKTSPNSWAEMNLEEEMKNKRVTLEKDKDKQGPISLAVTVTLPAKEEPKGTEVGKADTAKPAGTENAPAESKPSGQEATAPKKEARLAVFGDSEFAANQYYNLSGNGNLFLNTINWLTEETDLISIQPKTSSPKTIQLTPSQGRLIFFFSVLVLPLIVLVLGVSVWLRRRSL